MKYLKLYEQYNDEYEYEVVDVLERLIEGYKIRLDELDVIYEYFDGDIPHEFKYDGTLYRYVFFDDEDDYNNALNVGISPRDNYFLRCTKSMDAHDKFIEDLGAGYNYYIVFDIDSYECIFDVNKLCGHFGVSPSYGYEEEVIIESQKLSTDDIVDEGEI